MMMHYHKRQEELKVRNSYAIFYNHVPVCAECAFLILPLCHLQKLEEADDDSYLDSEWSDRQALKKKFQGLTNIKWGPR